MPFQTKNHESMPKHAVHSNMKMPKHVMPTSSMPTHNAQKQAYLSRMAAQNQMDDNVTIAPERFGM